MYAFDHPNFPYNRPELFPPFWFDHPATAYYYRKISLAVEEATKGSGALLVAGLRESLRIVARTAALKIIPSKSRTFPNFESPSRR